MRARVYLLLVLIFFVTASPPLFAEESLTWEQCLRETREAHPDLRVALALLQQAEADKRITAGSRLPHLSLSATVQQDGTSEKGGGSSLARSYSLSADQLLYDGKKTSRLVASNTEAIKAAQYNYRVVSADVRFALRSAFTELLQAQELLGLTGEIAERRERNVRLISLRYQGGREHIGALRQAQADLAQAEFEVAQAGRAVTLAQARLASALGRDRHQPIRVIGAFRGGDYLSEKPDFQQLAKNNPLFQQLDTRSNAARYDLDAARSAFAPELYLTSSVGKSSVERWPFDAVDWSAGLRVSVPIYEGGSGRARVSKAMAVVSQQSAQENSGYLKIFDTLKESWKNFLDAREMVVVKKKFLDAAVERSAIANAQYSNGLITFNDWVIIENNLVTAKKSYLNAGADLLIAEAQWIHAKGGGLDGQQE
ncbi:MAG: TolC family protein [Chlorobium sp.]|nr:MAG: TolC family protein [Chlorobium sp.]